MLFEAKDLCLRYTGAGKETVSHVNFTIDRGETLGIFGESGSGKSTIGQMVSGILRPTSGQMFFEDAPLVQPYKGEQRRSIQILFQHPEVSFDPRMKLLDSMREPYKFCHRTEGPDHLVEFLSRFGIYEEHLHRYPNELSGGELQRLALARVMLADPKLMVLDEPTSMLDVISQAQMIGLLREMQKTRGVSYLFISHDRCLCEQFCHRMMHLEDGVLSENQL